MLHDLSRLEEACMETGSCIIMSHNRRRRIAYAGFSRGGYAAAAMATRVGRATHAIVYHSLILKQQVWR